MAGRDTLNSIVRRLNWLITMTAADAATVDEMDTGISTQANFGLLIHKIEGVIDVGGDPVQTSDCRADFQLAIGQQTGLVSGGYNSNDLILQRVVGYEGIAASTSSYPHLMSFEWMAPPNLVIVNPTITAILDTTNMANACTTTGRIWFSPIELTELEVLRLLNA